MTECVAGGNLPRTDHVFNNGTSPQELSVGVLIPAAGMGIRLGEEIPKAFVELRGITLLQRCLHEILDSQCVNHCVIAVPDNRVESTRALFPPSLNDMTIDIVAGGKERADSVRAALEILNNVEVILVHDAARCLAPAQLIRTVVETVISGSDAVIPILPLVDTIKRINIQGRVIDTIDRSTLGAVQTPQGFRATTLYRAHHNADIRGGAAAYSGITDDAQLVEALGIPIQTVEGSPRAFKITTPMDLIVAEALIDNAHTKRA